MDKQQLSAQMPLIAERTIAWANGQEASALPFLVTHLKSLVEVGYENSPFERDARAHER